MIANSAESSIDRRLPNILLILVDDLGFGELGCYGNSQVSTPHIDSLATNGIRFTSGYVSAPYCAPSRAGLLTGRNQARFGYDINPVGKQNLNPRLGLPTNEITLAQMLKRSGYISGIIGKWHLGDREQFHPQQRGFDEYYGFLHEGHTYAPISHSNVLSFLRTNSLPGNLTRITNGMATWSTHTPVNEPDYDDLNPIWNGRETTEETQFLTDAWAREAISFVRRHKEHPFFLYVAFNAPHSPMQAQIRYLDRFKHVTDLHRRTFLAMLANLDDAVGQVLSTLSQLGIEENTFIIFLSDNGGPTRELTSSNAPFSGGKGTLLEGGIRIPFIFQWKSRLPCGRSYEYPISSLDIVPTVVSAAGVDFDADFRYASKSGKDIPHLDGIDLLPFLDSTNHQAPHARLFWRYGQNCAVRSGDWKLVKQGKDAPFRLYNLARDIGETTDISNIQPERFDALKHMLSDWLKVLPPAITIDP